jgi:hypothetical protein
MTSRDTINAWNISPLSALRWAGERRRNFRATSENGGKNWPWLRQLSDFSKFSADQGNVAAQVHSGFMLFNHRPLNANVCCTSSFFSHEAESSHLTLAADPRTRWQAMNCAAQLPRGSHTD